MDISFWYNSAYGSPVARAQGIGWIQELVARLTHTPIAVHNSSTNATLHRPETFPLGNSLYVDATHEVVVLNGAFVHLVLPPTCCSVSLLVITALNLSNFAENGPLPSDHIPKHRTFVASELAPFGTNIQFQRAFTLCSLLLSC